MKRVFWKRGKRVKGFTLIELIIVIAILAIIMLIASVAYAGIQERMKIRSDKATCAQIGKALRARETDLEPGKGIQLYPEVVEYDSLEAVGNYVSPGLTPQSMPDGGYIVTAIQTQTGKKIIVGIGKNDQEISTALYNNKENAGWAWCEDKEISKFVVENTSSFTPTKTLAGITGGVEGGSGEGGGGSSLVAIIANSAVPVGSYIAYSGGDYSGLWVVLRNNGGQLDIISRESVGTQTLSGLTGYKDCVKILNDKCATYVNSTYATSGRSVGATNSSIGQIDTTIYSISRGTSGGFPYTDEYYESDQGTIHDIGALRHSGDRVWLASRAIYDCGYYADFYVRYLTMSGDKGTIRLYGDGGSYTTVGEASYGVRPVISLKSGIKIIDGTGELGSPYVIGI